MALQNLLGDLALDATLVTIDTAIDSIDGKTPALGQALAAAAIPVVLTAIQVTALTPPTAITGFATSAKQDTLLTELQLKADLTETQPVSLASVPTHGVTGAFYQATQPVSIASMPSTPVTNADLATLAGAVSATHVQVDVLSMPAGGSGLTDAELRATAVPVSGTITVDTSALATSAKQLPDGHTVALSATDNAVLDVIAAKDFATQTTLAALNAKFASGTVIGDVNLSATDNAVLDAIEADTTILAGAVAATHMQCDVLTVPTVTVNAHAVTVASGGVAAGAIAAGAAVAGSLADGALVTLGAKTDAKSIATDATAVTAMQVLKQISASVQAPPSQAVTGPLTDAQLRATPVPISVASVPSHAVTNAGTFAVQATLAAETTKVIGTVNLGAVDNAVLDVIAAKDFATQATLAALNAKLVTGTVIGNVNLGAVDNAVLDAIVVNTAPITGIGHGVKVVTTAGTDVALAASTVCKRVTVQSQLDNTSTIVVGGSGVDATVATGTGIVLNPGDAYEFEIDNLADVYIDALVSGEGVRFCYYV